MKSKSKVPRERVRGEVAISEAPCEWIKGGAQWVRREEEEKKIGGIERCKKSEEVVTMYEKCQGKLAL